MNSLIAGVILILCLRYFFGRSEARKLVTQNIKLKALRLLWLLFIPMVWLTGLNYFWMLVTV